MSSPLATASRMYRTAIGALAASAWAIARASFISSAAGTTRLTRPMRHASSAEICCPDEQQLERAAATDQTRQPLRAGIPGQKAEIDLRLTELGGVGGDPNRARHREFAAAAEREPVDGGDHRFAETLDPIEERLSFARVFAAADRRLRRQLVDIRTGDEGAIARAREDQRAHRFVGAGLGDHLTQLVQRRPVQRVQHFRTVDRDNRDRAIPIDEHLFVRHNRRLYRPAFAPADRRGDEEKRGDCGGSARGVGDPVTHALGSGRQRSSDGIRR